MRKQMALNPGAKQWQPKDPAIVASMPFEDRKEPMVKPEPEPPVWTPSSWQGGNGWLPGVVNTTKVEQKVADVEMLLRSELAGVVNRIEALEQRLARADQERLKALTERDMAMTHLKRVADAVSLVLAQLPVPMQFPTLAR